MMIRNTRIPTSSGLNIVRFLSHESDKGSKRFIQTLPITKKKSSDFYSSLNYEMNSVKTKNSKDTTNSLQSSKWTSYKLGGDSKLGGNSTATPLRRSRASRFKSKNPNPSNEMNEMHTQPAEYTVIPDSDIKKSESQETKSDIRSDKVEPEVTAKDTISPKVNEEKPKKKRRPLKPRKAIISLSANAIEHLKGLLDKPDGKYIRVGVQNRGCSGLTYHLEYVDKAGKFDELVEQDGVKVFIDSKALFSIVGSEMDWLDDKLSSRFIFKNPNSKGTCGCGESFMV